MTESAADVAYATWYTEANGAPQQGELLRNFRAAQVNDSSVEPPSVSITSINATILTQSCDIPKTTQEYLLVAAILDYAEVQAAQPTGELSTKKGREALARSVVIAQFLVPPLRSWGWSWAIVDFRKTFSVPKWEVEAHVERDSSRVLLAPPYREHLSQAFARYMMRVGLQEPLKDFESWQPSRPS